MIAKWDGDQLTVYASTQGTFTVRDGVAEALKIDRKNVHVITEHMGGGFGSKLAPVGHAAAPSRWWPASWPSRPARRSS